MSWPTCFLALKVKLTCLGFPVAKLHLVCNVNAKVFDVVTQNGKTHALLQCFGQLLHLLIFCFDKASSATLKAAAAACTAVPACDVN